MKNKAMKLTAYILAFVLLAAFAFPAALYAVVSGKPTNLVAQSIADGIYLNWTDNSSTAFEIWRRDGISGTYKKHLDANIGQTNILDTKNLEAGKTYYYMVRGYTYGRADYTEYSNEVNAMSQLTTGAPAGAPPIITANLQNVSVKVGDTAEFTIQATGSGALTYQWEMSSGGSSWQALASMSPPNKLTWPNAQLATNGWKFRCLVSNSYGSVTSYEATLTVTAATTYNYVKFYFNGGNISGYEGPKTVQAISGEKVTAPDPPPVREGYVLGGWYTDQNLTAAYNFNLPVTTDFSLYAKWIGIGGTYTVTFNSNDGAFVPSAQVTAGNLLQRPANPTKPGYVFDAWYTDVNCTVLYNFNNPVNSSFTLYAKWVPTGALIVTFNSVGGSAVQSVSVAPGATLTKPTPDPTKPGYVFGGWCIDEGCTVLYTFGQVVNSNLTLYARWTPGTAGFTVIFDSKGGTAVQYVTVPTNGALTKPTPDPTKPGYVFGGWCIDEGCTVLYTFGQVVNSNFTLYAKWTQGFTITFNSMGGSALPPATVLPGAVSVKPAEDPKRDNFIFGGWYMDQACTIAYTFGGNVTANLTLYAKWTAGFTITFNSMGGSEVKNAVVALGGTVPRPDPDPVRPNFIFAGWYTDVNFTVLYNFNTNISGPFTLYAKWAASLTVTFNSMGGSYVPNAQVPAGGTVPKPPDPTRIGFVFAGWYIDDACTAAYNFNAPVAVNLTLYAKWTPAVTSGMFNFIKLNTYRLNLFPDVNENEWYGYSYNSTLKPIATAYEYGIMKGDDRGFFNAENYITIAEAITMAANVRNIYNGSPIMFPTTFPAGEPWYTVYVKYAIDNNIITATTFSNYEKAASRAEMAYIFSSSLPLSEFKVLNVVNKLPDANNATPYYSSVKLLYEAGIVVGDSGTGNFRPNDPIIRAEAATIISRVILPSVRTIGKTYS